MQSVNFCGVQFELDLICLVIISKLVTEVQLLACTPIWLEVYVGHSVHFTW